MKTIAHLSDLHFGTEDERIAEDLLKDLKRLSPSLVVVSGDLTQRARTGEFKAAANFLKRLPAPFLAVPGNHDVPLFDVVRRFAAPLARYRHWISEDLSPFYQDEEMAILGINTARSLTWKGGRISSDQIDEIKQNMTALPSDYFKILVTHHPFIPPPGDLEGGIELVGRATQALVVIDECEIDLLLAGHLHNSYTGDIRTYYPATNRSVIVAQAGTAISRRIRTEPNAYNLIRLDHNHVEISVRVRTATDGFKETVSTSYRRIEKEWLHSP